MTTAAPDLVKATIQRISARNAYVIVATDRIDVAGPVTRAALLLEAEAMQEAAQMLRLRAAQSELGRGADAV